jgi:hypothetical protein
MCGITAAIFDRRDAVAKESLTQEKKQWQSLGR